MPGFSRKASCDGVSLAWEYVTASPLDCAYSRDRFLLASYLTSVFGKNAWAAANLASVNLASFVPLATRCLLFRWRLHSAHSFCIIRKLGSASAACRFCGRAATAAPTASARHRAWDRLYCRCSYFVNRGEERTRNNYLTSPRLQGEKWKQVPGDSTDMNDLTRNSRNICDN